ncbi:MAG: hypothetical protein HY784_16615 [Chloroflexi bacterium]|nr:hypothetical protein [Chloroflexota bacterium]
MFDNLRQQADSSPFIEEEDLVAEAHAKTARGRLGNFLGLTPVQRFVLALMLFLNVCVLGSFCLLATERIVLPF